MKLYQVLIAAGALLLALYGVAWLSRPAATVVEHTHTESVHAGDRPPISETGPYPVAKVEPSHRHDFGRMAVGSTDSHTFMIRNEGEAPLLIGGGETTCQCTVSDIDRKEVPPGEAAKITLTWEPDVPTDDFLKGATFYTNDPNNSVINLEIAGAVFQELEAEPGWSVNVGSIPEEMPTPFEVKLYSKLLRDFAITSVSADRDYVTVEQSPLTDEELAKLPGARSGYSVQGELQPTMGIGRFDARVTVETDREPSGTYMVYVSGLRPGPVTILGRDWTGQTMTLRLGDVRASAGASKELALLIDPAEEPLRIEKATVTPDILDVSLAKDENFASPARERYILTFTVPPGVQPGVYGEDNPVRVNLELNREEMQTLELFVRTSIVD